MFDGFFFLFLLFRMSFPKVLNLNGFVNDCNGAEVRVIEIMYCTIVQTLVIIILLFHQVFLSVC